MWFYYACFLKGVPSPPTDQVVNLLATKDNDVTIQLTWSQNNSHCVVLYHIEAVSANSSINLTTTSQHITLTLRLQVGEGYSFRVRGADILNRGEWSGLFSYTYQQPAGKFIYL